MASGAVFDAIKAHIQSNWTATPVRYENEAVSFDIENGASFIDQEITGTAYGQQSIGASRQEDNRWDEEGVLWLHVMVKANTGSSTARAYAKQLCDMFRGVRLLSDSLEFGDAFIGRGHPGFEDGMYFRISVFINWRRIDA